MGWLDSSKASPLRSDLPDQPTNSGAPTGSVVPSAVPELINADAPSVASNSAAVEIQQQKSAGSNRYERRMQKKGKKSKRY
jgi:hypothetical protein